MVITLTPAATSTIPAAATATVPQALGRVWGRGVRLCAAARRELSISDGCRHRRSSG